jgi:4-hydroxy-3-methylbut-2-enyl diphosphate reductase
MPSPASLPRTITARSSSTIKANQFTYAAGRLTIHLAQEFGFCYGVDRAVDYAYQTRPASPTAAFI